MPFFNCELNQNEFREYEPGYPFMGKAFIPYGGTIDRKNDLRLFKYGNGPLREPSNNFQFIFDYKGTPLKIQLKRILNDNYVHWSNCFIEHVEKFEYDYEDVIRALRDAMKVYAYTGYSTSALMKMNEQVTVHIEF